ncbi:hypothetical protein [Nocardia sp. NPDC051981]|uniref:hypothetical protein n=1 Tax=Nocardia sp. NPDC051981 TaxID=3155417 RepID=UPI003441EC9C
MVVEVADRVFEEERAAPVIATAGPLGRADTYNLMVRTLGMDPDGYERWLSGTWLRLATTPSTLPEA